MKVNRVIGSYYDIYDIVTKKAEYERKHPCGIVTCHEGFCKWNENYFAVMMDAGLKRGMHLGVKIGLYNMSLLQSYDCEFTSDSFQERYTCDIKTLKKKTWVYGKDSFVDYLKTQHSKPKLRKLWK